MFLSTVVYHRFCMTRLTSDLPMLRHCYVGSAGVIHDHRARLTSQYAGVACLIVSSECEVTGIPITPPSNLPNSKIPANPQIPKPLRPVTHL